MNNRNPGTKSQMIGVGEGLLFVCTVLYGLFRLLALPYFITLVLLAVSCFIGYLYWSSGLWDRLGVPCVPQNLLFGNFLEAGKNGFRDAIADWISKYGNVVGCNFFGTNNLIIADVDMLKQIFVKDFHIFTNHMGSPLINDDSQSIFSHILTMIKDQKWKDVRSTVTPAFTSGKMKQMVHFINNCSVTFGEILDEKAEQDCQFEVKQLCGNFTMDVIAAAAFAQRIDAQRDQNSKFVVSAKEIMSVNDFKNRILWILMLFPTTCVKLDVWFGIRTMVPKADAFFTTTLNAIIEDRKKNPQSKPDFLQLLLNSMEAENEDTETDELISHKDIGGKKVRLTNKEIISQAFIFLLAGYDTTANTLHFIMYLLAIHPDIQTKCREEIENVVGDDLSITYEHIQNMPYLESVMFETLRIFPPASFTDRVASEDYEINGVTIPKDTVVLAPIHYIHHNPDFYPDPETFDPDRFSPEERKKRNPVTFLSFGFGPRNCIGMRFAQMEIKLIMAYLLPKFEFLPTENTETLPIKLSKTNMFTQPEKPITLKVKRLAEKDMRF